MINRELEYRVGDERYVGSFFAEDGAGRRPGVLVIPEGGGLTDHTRSIAAKLAGSGFAALAMDYYGGGKALTDINEVMPRLAPWFADPTGIREIAKAALDVLAGQPETDAGALAAIGYCFGGTTALELGRCGAPVKAIVGFHCGLGTARPAAPGSMRIRVLVQVGTADPLVPAEHRAAFEAEMTAAGADWRMILMGGVGHSFTNPGVDALDRPGFRYDAVADRRSWAAMIDLFGEVFSIA
ncbi:MAG TPA: dienelactone hydrolase family protein [Caulobacteraceae bacterium]|nr:dienelactone hydrolase family protein [Caulobacteraceae bacterium]